MQPDASSVTVVADYACHVGEGPLWHAAEQRLYWTDILSPRLFCYHPASGHSTEYRQARPLGGFTIQSDGSLLLFRDHGNVVTWKSGRELQTIVDSIPQEEGHRFNDCLADPQGRVFAGTLTLRNELSEYEKRTGRLYRIDPDRSYRVLLEGFGVANGMGFSPDLRHFYFTDSLDCTISRFDYDRGSGDIGDRQIIIQTDPDKGRPDGMTVDVDGDLWVAMWSGACVVRYRPDGSERQRIAMPTSCITSVAFGGESFSRLFVTTAMGNDRAKFGPQAGATFAVDAGVRGRAEFTSRVNARTP